MFKATCRIMICRSLVTVQSWVRASDSIIQISCLDTLPISVECPTVTKFNTVTFIKNTTWFENRFRHSVSSCNEASVIIVVQLVLPVFSVAFWGSFSPWVCECWSLNSILLVCLTRLPLILLMKIRDMSTVKYYM